MGSENAVRNYYNVFNPTLRFQNILVERDINRREGKLQYTYTGCVLKGFWHWYICDVILFQILLLASPLVLRMILSLLVYSMPSCRGNCCSLRLQGTLTVGVATRVSSSWMRQDAFCIILWYLVTSSPPSLWRALSPRKCWTASWGWLSHSSILASDLNREDTSIPNV